MSKSPCVDELASWVRLTLEPGIGAVHARVLLAAIGLPQDIYSASTATLAKHIPADMAAQLRQPASPQAQALIERTLEWLAAPGHHLLTLADPAYPPALLDTHDPPTVLYINGEPSLLNQPIISIVGARNATPAGCENALAFAAHLADRGWCIASGLAHGIDTAAHLGALQAGPKGGSTIAVMGTGIDIIYPSANLDLAHRIAHTGALVSELPLGTPSVPHQFPRRNRIVAGLARGVLVVEAARQSGSLITARLASELGREVFSIPGSIHSPLSRGCHALIRQGAKLVESGQDIHEELERFAPPAAQQSTEATPTKPAYTRRRAKARSPDTSASSQTRPQAGQSAGFAPRSPEARLLEALGHDPVGADALQARTGLDMAQLNGLLLRFELNETLARLEDGRYQRQAQRARS